MASDNLASDLWGDSSGRVPDAASSGERTVQPPISSPPDGRHEAPAVYRTFVTLLAEVLDREALRSSKIILVLDLSRARECRKLARGARRLAARFAFQVDVRVSYADRQALLYDYFALVREARALAFPPA